MPYYEGAVNTIAELADILRNRCQDNGWTLSGNIIHKGSCQVQVAVVGSTLTVLGGTGVSGSTLTGPAPSVARVGTAGIFTMVFPATYELAIHTDPDECYLFVKYGGEFVQYIAFGRSDRPLPGNGTWFAASMGAQNPTQIRIAPDNISYGIAGVVVPGLFWGRGLAATSINSMIHHGLLSPEWSVAPTSSSNWVVAEASIVKGLWGLMASQPSALNGAAILLPHQIWLRREETNVSLVADLAHSRALRIDNFAPGEVIALGPDQWKVYPFYRKNLIERDGGINIEHTGTMGMAIRYDGP